MARLLVVGVRPGSLGWHVSERAQAEGFDVTCADIKGGYLPEYERAVIQLDVTTMPSQDRFWVRAPHFNSVVYAAGVNEEGSAFADNWRAVMARQMAVNFAGAMETLQRWVGNGAVKRANNHFVTIASNSAYIPRSTGMGYCASKAAVVMAMRCAAREYASNNHQAMFPSIYTYSPGWLNGTPMSEQVRERLYQKQQGLKPHRIPGGVGVDPASLAQIIVRNLSIGDGRLLNGTDIRLDGGEI